MILCKMPTKVSNKEKWAKARITLPPAKQPAPLPAAAAAAQLALRARHLLSSPQHCIITLATLFPIHSTLIPNQLTNRKATPLQQSMRGPQPSSSVSSRAVPTPELRPLLYLKTDMLPIDKIPEVEMRHLTSRTDAPSDQQH